MKTVYHHLFVPGFALLLSFPAFAQPTENLVGYWPFNGSPDDLGPNSYATINNGAELTADRFGNEASAYYFDGVSDHMQIGNTSDFNFAANQDFSVSVWIKPDGAQSNFVGILTNGTGSDAIKGWSIRYTSDGIIIAELSNGVDTRIRVFCVSCSSYINDWINITTVVERTGTMKFFVGGSMVSEINVANFNIELTNTTFLYFGKWYSYYFKGAIDDIRIFNRVLTSAEIAELVNEPDPAATAAASPWQTTGANIFTTAARVGIGTSEPDATLAVKGNINAQNITVNGTVPSSDFVFEEDYPLMELNELKQFIQENKHLPEVPSAVEFEAEGYNLGEMDDVLLRKIEELTLYILHLEERIKQLESEQIIEPE